MILQDQRGFGRFFRGSLPLVEMEKYTYEFGGNTDSQNTGSQLWKTGIWKEDCSIAYPEVGKNTKAI